MQRVSKHTIYKRVGQDQVFHKSNELPRWAVHSDKERVNKSLQRSANEKAISKNRVRQRRTREARRQAIAVETSTMEGVNEPVPWMSIKRDSWQR